MRFYCFASSLFSFADMRLIVGFPPLAVICTGIVTSDYSTIRTTFRRYLFLDVAHHHLSKRGASDLSNYADQTYSGGQGLQLWFIRRLPLGSCRWLRLIFVSWHPLMLWWGRRRSSLLPLGKLHQQCHVMFIYSTAGPFQLASFTNGVALHLSWGWKCSTERRSRYRGAPGDHGWMIGWIRGIYW